MMNQPHPLTDNTIAISVVPSHKRWPPRDTGVAWTSLHEGVESLLALARAVDNNCVEIEQNSDLTLAGVERRRAEVGVQAMHELKNCKELQRAEKTIANVITFLEEKMTDLPKLSESASEELRAREIRDFIRSQKSPLDFVLANASDHRILAAVLHAPGFLTGLKPAELNLVQSRVRKTLHPEQVAVQEALGKAIAELRAGIPAVQRLLLERCQLREDSDGVFRAASEPAPKPRLTVVPTAAVKQEAKVEA